MRRLLRLMLWQMGKCRYRVFSCEPWDKMVEASPWYGKEPFWYDAVEDVTVRTEMKQDRALTRLWGRFRVWRYWGNESLFGKGE